MVLWSNKLFIKLFFNNFLSYNLLLFIYWQNNKLFLLLLTRAHILEDVRNVIIGSNILFNPSGLIPFQKMEIYNSILEDFNFELSDSSYELLELESDSTVYNSSSFFTMIGMFFIANLIIIGLNKMFKSWETSMKWKFFIEKILRILNRVIQIMTYGYYIRFILQSNQFLLISSMHEIWTFNTTNTVRILSYIFAWLVLFACFSLIVLVAYLSLSSYEVKEDSHNKIGEFFLEVSMKKKAKLYIAFLIIRRTIFVMILVALSSTSSKLMIVI